MSINAYIYIYTMIIHPFHDRQLDLGFCHVSLTLRQVNFLRLVRESVFSPFRWHNFNTCTRCFFLNVLV